MGADRGDIWGPVAHQVRSLCIVWWPRMPGIHSPPVRTFAVPDTCIHSTTMGWSPAASCTLMVWDWRDVAPAVRV